MKRIIRNIVVILGCMCLMFAPCSNNGKVCKAADYSWIDDGNSGDKNFSKYTKQFKIEIHSLFKVLSTVAYTIAAAMLIWTGAKFAMTRNGQKRKEVQDKLLVVVLVIILLAGFGTIFQIAADVGKSLDTANNTTGRGIGIEVSI